jgi:endonuclease YncB( thermonuclease family)
MTRTVLAVAFVLLPMSVEGATLHRSLPHHVSAAGVSRAAHVRSGDRLRPRQPPPRPRGHRVSVTRAPAARQALSPAVIHVHDGDTFYVGGEAVRIRGIDTPELGQPRAYEATRRLIELLHAGPVTIVRRAEDVYGRVVADVFVGGRDVARVLTREGYAKPRRAGRLLV